MFLDFVDYKDIGVQFESVLLEDETAELLSLLEFRRTLCKMGEKPLVRGIKSFKYFLDRLCSQTASADMLCKVFFHPEDVSISAKERIISLLQRKCMIPYECSFAKHLVKILVAFRMATTDRYTCSRHCIYNVSYHIIWCPKYRRKVLVDGVDERLKELLQEKAQMLDVVIERMEVMPDHVHLFVKANPQLPIHFIVNQFKGYSSVILRNEFPKLKSRLPSLWTHSYYVETIGHISEATIKKYIEDQKKV